MDITCIYFDYFNIVIGRHIPIVIIHFNEYGQSNEKIIFGESLIWNIYIYI